MFNVTLKEKMYNDLDRNGYRLECASNMVSIYDMWDNLLVEIIYDVPTRQLRVLKIDGFEYCKELEITCSRGLIHLIYKDTFSARGETIYPSNFEREEY